MNKAPQPPRSRRRFLQFSLRGLLLLTLVAAGVVWWWTQPEKLIEPQGDGSFHVVRYVLRDERGNPYNDGPWRLVGPAGRVLIEGEYRNGIQIGLWRTWHPTGGLASSGEYSRGERQGLWTTWHSDGALESELTYEAGKVTGPAKYYADHGSLQAEGELANGLRVGQWTIHAANGRVIAQGEYAANVRVGTWHSWNGEGAPLPDTFFSFERELPHPDQTMALWRERLFNTQGLEQAHAAQVISQIGEPAYPALHEVLASGNVELVELVLRTTPPRDAEEFQADFAQMLRNDNPRIRDLAAIHLQSWQIDPAALAADLEQAMELQAAEVLASNYSIPAVQRFGRLVDVVTRQAAPSPGQIAELRDFSTRLQWLPQLHALAAVVSHSPPNDELTRQLVTRLLELNEWNENVAVPKYFPAASFPYPYCTWPWSRKALFTWPALVNRSPAAFLSLLERGSLPDQYNVLQILGWLQQPSDDDATALVSELIHCLEMGDAELNRLAVMTLPRFGEKARVAVPRIVALRGRSSLLKEVCDRATDGILLQNTNSTWPTYSLLDQPQDNSYWIWDPMPPIWSGPRQSAYSGSVGVF